MNTRSVLEIAFGVLFVIGAAFNACGCRKLGREPVNRGFASRVN